MDRDQALAECLRLSREAPDRDRYEFIPRELGGGGWQVVKVALPEGIKKHGETTPETKPPPEPPHPGQSEEQRQAPFQWGGG